MILRNCLRALSVPVKALVRFSLLLLVLSAHATLAGNMQAPSLRQLIDFTSADYPITALGITLKTEALLKTFYIDRGFELAWHDQQGSPTPQARAIVDLIGAIGDDGLQPNDYHFDLLNPHFGDRSQSQPQTAFTRSATDYDLLLTDAVLNLSQHLLVGKVDPETLSAEWKAQRRHKDLVTVLATLVDTHDVASSINELRPKQVRYFRLRELIARMRQLPAPEWQPLATAPAIKPGASDLRIAAVRERLAYWGDWLPERSAAPAQPPDGSPEESLIEGTAGNQMLNGPGTSSDTSLSQTLHSYDRQLQLAVQKFQRRHGLEQDGVMGRKTLEALNVTPAERTQQIVNNLERWRWLAEELGEKHVLVNIAGFELKAVENNQTILRKPVIVGRDYRRTPVFSDRIRYLVFNPTWTVPFSLAVKDKIPEIRQDPSYISRMGFTVYDRNNNPVDPATIDWNQVSARNFPYRMVQAPGPLNALGQVKFMFPNAYDVYLHDTPARDLFSKTDRAFSSGCVRVSDPLELAAWLLQANGVDRTQLEAIVAKGQLQTISLKRPVPVHIEYWTAWIDSSGELHFRNDIYRRDPPLAAALAAPYYASASPSVEPSANNLP